ncbi:hypothetical protein CCP4SC76_2260008 [Gammaproteobacteria bacterium]
MNSPEDFLSSLKRIIDPHSHFTQRETLFHERLIDSAYRAALASGNSENRECAPSHPRRI